MRRKPRSTPWLIRRQTKLPSFLFKTPLKSLPINQIHPLATPAVNHNSNSGANNGNSNSGANNSNSNSNSASSVKLKAAPAQSSATLHSEGIFIDYSLLIHCFP